MNSRLYNRIKSCLYIFAFMISIAMKWTVPGEDGPFAFIVINQIIYFPMLLMIGFMYFHYRYYRNTFIQTRFKSLQEVRYHHFQSNISEAIEFLVWQIVIAIILGFQTFSIGKFLFISCYYLDFIIDVPCLYNDLYNNSRNNKTILLCIYNVWSSTHSISYYCAYSVESWVIYIDL